MRVRTFAIPARGGEDERLLADLSRRFKDRGVLAPCRRIVEAHHTAAGRGLPIGALTSQHFANLYLGGFDRYTVWWSSGRAQVREVIDVLAERRGLTVKPTWQVGPSEHGIRFCGLRVLPRSLRRRRRYRRARRRWEGAYCRGEIDALMLQRGYDSALAITAHADAKRWRGLDLERNPPPDA